MPLTDEPKASVRYAISDTNNVNPTEEQAHLQLLGEMQGELSNALAKIDVASLSGVNRYLHPTCGGVSNLVFGFLALKKVGNTHAARVLIRTCIEATLKIATVFERPEALYRIAYTEHVGDAQFLTAADENNIVVTPGMIDAKWAKRKVSLIAMFPNEALKDAPISAQTMGQWSKMADLYNFQFKLYCNYTHATLRAHAMPEHFEPELDYLTLEECLFATLAVTKKRLGGDCPNLDVYFARVKDLGPKN